MWLVKVWLHSFLTSAVDGSEWLASGLGRFNPGKGPRFSLSRKLGGSQSQSEHLGEQKNLILLPGFKCQFVQPIA
jgi:hypothetical protein